jgi:hypothetical protein
VCHLPYTNEAGVTVEVIDIVETVFMASEAFHHQPYGCRSVGSENNIEVRWSALKNESTFARVSSAMVEGSLGLRVFEWGLERSVFCINLANASSIELLGTVVPP